MFEHIKEFVTNPLGYYKTEQNFSYGLKIFFFTLGLALTLMTLNEYFAHVLTGESFEFSSFFFELVRFTLLNSFLIFLLLLSTPQIRKAKDKDKYTNHLVAGGFVNLLIYLIHGTTLLISKGSPGTGLASLLPIGGFVVLVLWPFFVATLALQSANLSVFLNKRFKLHPLAGMIYGVLAICLSFIIAFSLLI